MAKRSWSIDEVELLKKLWADGFSAEDMVSQFRGKTRNAICGKLRRLGIDATARLKPKRHGPTIRPTRPRPVAELAIINATLPPNQLRKLQGLDETTCRWPLGDPRHDSFCFCGGHAPVEVPYCSAHSSFAYQRS